ncbi:MAG: hypothetical protein AB7K04_00830 [Pseudorhodoplanes sp.]
MLLTRGALLGFLAALCAPPAIAQTGSPVLLVQASPALAAAMTEYRRKLEIYQRARAQFDEQAEAYWSAIAEKRKRRFAKRRERQEIVLEDYVLTQPPLYTGPSRPVDPSGTEQPSPPRAPIPVVADFLRNAAEQFQFVPQKPQSEIAFKRAYAQVAAAAGLTRDQVVRVYAFESGGNGKYDVQAGLEYSRNKRAISTALGYNQLLTTNTVSILAERGDEIVRALRRKAETLSPDAKRALERKIAVLQRMIHFTRSIPRSWSEQAKIANTPRGLGTHAMVLDVDVGPYLLTQKLLDSILFARAKGYQRPLTAAELEMMNLTGDGNGFDMVSMPAAMRPKVPTANFFQRGGYERNPVAIRNNVVSTLLAATDAKMDKEMLLPGARDMAAAYDAAR